MDLSHRALPVFLILANRYPLRSRRSRQFCRGRQVIRIFSEKGEQIVPNSHGFGLLCRTNLPPSAALEDRGVVPQSTPAKGTRKPDSGGETQSSGSEDGGLQHQRAWLNRVPLEGISGRYPTRSPLIISLLYDGTAPGPAWSVTV